MRAWIRSLRPGRWTSGGWEAVPVGLLILVLACSGAWAAVAWMRPSVHVVSVTDREVNVFHTSWSYKDEFGLCQPAEWTGTQGEFDPNETAAQFAARCRTTVAALKVEFPPDPTCPQAAPQ